jgi:predicted metal-dependent peptidase
MDAERKLKKVKISIMRNPQFALWQGVLMIGKTKVVDDVPTALTNGRDEMYGRKFVEELTESELAFVVLHEAMHKAFRHLTTWKKLHDENHLLANAACDYVINLMLVDMDRSETVIRFPRYKSGPNKGQRMGLVDEKYRGMNAKQVFDLLKKEYEGGGEGMHGDGFDKHDWEGAAELSDEQKRELEREVDSALRQGQIAAKKVGKGSSNTLRDIEELLAPKVDWREELREFVKAFCTNKDRSSWRRVNRRYLATDVYMPSMIGEKVGHLVIGIDTSGSIGEELAEFLSEVKSIAEEVSPEKVDLLYWDHSVTSHESYDSASVPNIVSSTKPTGGGGTAPSCVSKYLQDKKIKPECVVMFTDGYVGGDWGSGWESPLLWVITGGSRGESAQNGKVIYI